MIVNRHIPSLHFSNSQALDVDTLQILKRWTGEYSDKFISAFDLWIKEVKEGQSVKRMYNQFDFLLPMFPQNQHDYLQNIVKDAHHGTQTGVLIHTPFEGVKGNNAGRIEVDYNASSDGVTFTETNGSVGAFVLDNLNEARDAMGARDNPGNFTLLKPRSSDKLSAAVNSDGFSQVAVPDSLGMVAAIRNDADNVIAAKNKTIWQETAEPSIGIPNQKTLLFGRNENGSATSLCSFKVAFFWQGAGMTETQYHDFFDATSKFFS